MSSIHGAKFIIYSKPLCENYVNDALSSAWTTDALNMSSENLSSSLLCCFNPTLSLFSFQSFFSSQMSRSSMKWNSITPPKHLFIVSAAPCWRQPSASTVLLLLSMMEKFLQIVTVWILTVLFLFIVSYTYFLICHQTLSYFNFYIYTSKPSAWLQRAFTFFVTFKFIKSKAFNFFSSLKCIKRSWELTFCAFT